MKKNSRRWISITLVITMIFCMLPLTSMPSIAAEETDSKYIDMASAPANIQSLLTDTTPAAANTSPQKARAAIATNATPKIVNTDDMNSIRIEDGSGNGVAKVFGVPVRYADDDGNLHFIDTSMTEENWVKAKTSGYDYRNAAGSMSIQFSKKPDKGVRVNKDFTIAVHNSEKLKLPKGYADQLEDGSGRMVYPKAFGEHTYVEYINTNTGMKENIVLEKNISKNRFDYVFESKDYIPVLSEDGSCVNIVQKNNPENVVYSFSPLYVYDSYEIPEEDLKEEETEPSKEPIMAGVAGGAATSVSETQESDSYRHFTEDNHYEVVELSKGKYIITSVVSEDFLNNPETVYPVIIDPSFGSTNSNAQDTSVWKNNGGNTTNYGSLDYIRFGRKSGGDMIGYFRFTQLPSLPSNVTITDASLKFTFRSGQTSGADGICFIVTSKQWDENSITWNNQPYGSWGYGSSTNNFKYYNFYVKPFVEMWYYGGYPNYGVDFTYENMINDYNSVVSSEGEAHRAPTLTISYTSATPLTADNYYNGSLTLGNSDWYRFTPTTTGKYSFSTLGSTDTYGELYRGSTKLTSNDDGGEGLNFRIIYNLTAGTTYYLKVRGYNYEKTGNYQVVVSKDPFHPANIEYIRIKKYDMTDYGGDSNITTVVTKSYLQDERYFECSAPGRAEVAFTINSALINSLNQQEASYQSYPNMYLPNFYFHLAKLGVDDMAKNGIISSGSDEYYGIWASEANRLLAAANKLSNQIQLSCAIITTCYSIYNVVSGLKSLQMAYNTTTTVNNATYTSTYNSLKANYLQGGTGYGSFDAAKRALGSAGTNKAWHHIVEQNQIGSSGFSATSIHNTKNLVSIESGFSGSIHGKISGHYSSVQGYTGGLTVRQWLSGKSFQFQFEYGLDQLSKYGTIKPTSTGWIFTPY